MVGKQRPKTKNHASLTEQIQSARFATAKKQLSQKGQKASVGGQAHPDHNSDDDDELSNERTPGARLQRRAAQHIMKASREHLRDSDEEDEAVPVEGEFTDEDPAAVVGLAGDFDSVPERDPVDDDDDDDAVAEIEYDDNDTEISEMPSEAQDFGEAFGINEEEAEAFDRFQPQGSAVRSRTLADIIMAKIKEQETAAARSRDQAGNDDSESGGPGSHIDHRVRKVYVTIGSILKHYKSGKIPKAFKMLPHIQHWEELLMLTKPQEWSPHACYSATRIFASNLNERMAQRFYNAILLPIVHDAMNEQRKLHPALCMALRKALFKPIAFFKGFLLPLCSEGECSLREAMAIAYVLQKVHLPPVPTAVTLVKISQMPYTPALALFLRVLIDKKMALPYQAVDALVKYFHRFTVTHPSSEPLPVLWHQTLLCFVQHYKFDLTPEQTELLRQVCTRHFHYMITPEVRREVAAAIGSREAAVAH